MEPILALETMKEGHDGSGLGIMLKDLGGEFEALKGYPILSGICSESGLEAVDTYMQQQGFQTKHVWAPSIREVKGIRKRDYYFAKVYQYPESYLDRTMQERLGLASMTANYIDYSIRQNLLRLEESVEAEGSGLSNGDLEAVRHGLRSAYFQTMFNDQVFVTDERGRVTWAEPAGESARGEDLSVYPYLAEALSTGRQTASPLILLEPSGKPVVAAATPLKDRAGHVVGLVGGYIDLTNSTISQVISPVSLGATGYIEVVDSAAKDTGTMNVWSFDIQ